MQQRERHLPLNGAVNVRDLGGYAVAGGKTTRWGRFLRADSPHHLDHGELAMLVDYGITTVIDLRREDELRREPNPFAEHARVAYHNVSLFEAMAPSDYVRNPNLLPDLYIRALGERRAAFAEVLNHIAAASEGGVLFHCTVGKDRTGLIAAILLLIAGADRETVLQDYAMTGPLIAPLIDTLARSAEARGIDPVAFQMIARCDPSVMVTALDALDTTHGGLESWLSATGIERETVSAIRQSLLGP